MKVKAAACVALVGVQLFASIVLKVATSGEGYSFSPQSSLVLSEVIKMVLSAGYVVRESGSGWRAMREQSSAGLVTQLGGLAVLYCVNNAVMFWLFARADPGSITLVKSGATVVSAVLLYFVRGLRLSANRWTVIVVQMLGLVVAQYDSCAGRAQLSARVYAALVMSVVNSSVANVWNERVVQRFEAASLGVKNVYLYMFGAVLNGGAFAALRATRAAQTPRFWEGYSAAALCVVGSNALMGIAINCVYKYADAVVKNVATSTTTALLVGVSAVMFGGRRDAMAFVGAALVLAGTFLYLSLGAAEEELCARRGASPAMGSGGASDGQRRR